MGKDSTAVNDKERPTIPDMLIDWARGNSLWPMFFGLSCCFIEEAAALTARYDLARFGAEVLRPSPRQSDLLIVSGTVFKKIAPVVLRLYEQMAEPRWVISMGSCANSGGMYDVYSVVQGVDQFLPVDVYIPGCPPRPEAVIAGLVMLQKKIKQERPIRPVLRLPGGSQGSRTPIRKDGRDKSRDPRGPGMAGIPIRGTSVTLPDFRDSRSDLMWTPPAGRVELTERQKAFTRNLMERFVHGVSLVEPSSDIPTFQVTPDRILDVLRHLKERSTPCFRRLDDLTAVDESRRRQLRTDDPEFTLVYHLLAFDPAERVRLQVLLRGRFPEAKSITGIWPSAAWYEREAYDMFGLRFSGNTDMRRLILPHDWQGHPLRKEYPCRANQLPPYGLEDARKHQPRDADAAFPGRAKDNQFLLNLGPHHVSTHGLIRYILALNGEEITDLDIDIGYHHRAAEKMGENQNWHQYIPYTDRVDYLAGAANNLPYLLAVEKLAGIQVPARAQVIRVLLSELFRLSNHLVWLGTMAHDLGAMTPNFYTFREREMIMDIVEMITGGRMHPSWFRIGGVAKDLPADWHEPIARFIDIFPARLREYESLLRDNPIFKARTLGIGRLTLDQAIEWGVSGPNLRACGLAWDLRKAFPYSGYDQFDFEIPTAESGDSYARYLVRTEEMRQSIRIIRQAIDQMPTGRFLTDDYRYAMPLRQEMLTDIETLIHHFIHVSRGPKIPPGQAHAACEVPRGEQGYFIVSDGLGYAYRTRIRGPGFANIQALPLMARGENIANLIAIIGSLDYIMSDIDR